MKRILTAIVLIAVVFGLIFWNNREALTVFSGLVACLAAYEYAALTKAGGAPVPIWWMIPAVIIFFVVTDFRPMEAPLPVLSFLGLSLLTWSAFRGRLDHALPIAASGFFALIYIAYPLSLLPLFAQMDNGIALLLFLMLAVWTGDIAALYVGKAYGKHKLSVLSPNKTWEGAAASIVGAVLITGVLISISAILEAHGNTLLHISEPAWQTLLLAALVNLAAQVGDLLESAIKRGVGVKDSGAMLPGHGGILDRIDAMLTAAPVLYYLLLLKEAAGMGGF